mmetsp:Transcript_4649/g.7045  ORF Transcript_4649/g.7045 Transcript_4649/m.7045 type:complete len:332 (+) Transcript_4649:62-1057(+)|eukprot:scaffold5127_cov191-Skeletonema_dohrnii-CCMP3373.AAC.1
MSDEQSKSMTADTVPSLVSAATTPSSSKKKKSKKEKKRKHEDSPSSSAKKKHKKEKKKDKKDKKNQTEAQSGEVSKDVVTASSSQELSAPSQSDIQMAHANRPETSPNTFSFISSTSVSNNPEEKNSPFQVKTILGSVALLPSSLPNVPKTIKSLLHSLLLMYDANMGGVLLSLDDGIKLLPLRPRPNGSRSNNNGNNSNGLVGGRIVDDLPYVHYRFQFQGLLFCPNVGMKLKGQVIECTPTFITLTTNHILTTKISTEKLNQQGFFYNGVTLEWTRERVDTAMKQDTDDEDEVLGPSTSIYLDDTVEFVVERIHECGGYISLDGASPTV